MQYGMNRLQLTEQRRCQQQGDPSFHIFSPPFIKKQEVRQYRTVSSCFQHSISLGAWNGYAQRP